MADITKIDRFIQEFPRSAWLATTQGYCVCANPALESLTGFNSDQINQADWRSFLLEEDRAVASAAWQRSLATEAANRVHVRRQPLDRFRVLWDYFRVPVTRAQSDMKAESSQHFASPKSCSVQSSAVKILDHPFSFQCNPQQSRSQCSADMGPPLTPIQAGACEATP
jgi:hypothetical protein